MKAITRVKDWFLNSIDYVAYEYNKVVEYVTPIAVYIWAELVYFWKSFCVLMAWRVPFLNWVSLSPAFNLVYGVYLLAIGGSYLWQGVYDPVYLNVGLLYFIVFMWFGLWWIDTYFSRRMIGIHKDFGEAMSQIANDLLQDNKTLLAKITEMEEAQRAEREQQKQPGQVEVVPGSTPVSATLNPPVV